MPSVLRFSMLFLWETLLFSLILYCLMTYLVHLVPLIYLYFFFTLGGPDKFDPTYLAHLVTLIYLYFFFTLGGPDKFDPFLVIR